MARLEIDNSSRIAIYWDSYLKFIGQTTAKSESSFLEPMDKRKEPDVERDLMAGSFHLLDYQQKKVW